MTRLQENQVMVAIEIIANRLNGHTIQTKTYMSATQNPNWIQELYILTE